MRLRPFILSALVLVAGCATPKKPQPYGHEAPLYLPGDHPRVWGIAPAINLSGQNGVDSLIQADLLYQQLQPVQGVTIVPVDRVVAVYQALQISHVQSEAQANAVCKALGLDGLLVPTVTAYDPYNPPKFGAALQLFEAGQTTQMPEVNVQKLAQEAAPAPGSNEPVHVHFLQVVGMYDASNGSVRNDLKAYAAGRYDPESPLGIGEYYENMNRYCGFVYHDLLRKLFERPQLNQG
ncbi:MAG TPA: hypothetical protein VG722_05970 [Tepidisphaeraceae bacterium]|nr:hypothetical protein [Tepidisphaeraceae bacterium]